MNKRLVFIGSGGRTGTNFLGDELSRMIDDCHSEHEPDLFQGLNRKTWQRVRSFGAWHMVIGRALGLSGTRVTGTKFLTSQITIGQVKRTLERQRKTYHARCEESLIIESYYAWWMVAPFLNQIFPGSKFIGVVRDPRSWISSWQAKQEGRDRGHWSHFFPPGPLNAITLRDPEWAARWEDIGPIGRLAWQWMAIVRQMTLADSSFARVFRFEDIFGPEGNSALYELLSFASEFPDRRYPFRVPDVATTTRTNRSAATGLEWKDWSQNEKAIVNEICEPYLTKFGYERL